MQPAPPKGTYTISMPVAKVPEGKKSINLLRECSTKEQTEEEASLLNSFISKWGTASYQSCNKPTTYGSNSTLARYPML